MRFANIWNSPSNIRNSMEVTGVNAGTATITYIGSNSCGADTATEIIKVNDVPHIDSITGPTVVNYWSPPSPFTYALAGNCTTCSNTYIWSTSSPLSIAGLNINPTVTMNVATSSGNVYIFITVTNGDHCWQFLQKDVLIIP